MARISQDLSPGPDLDLDPDHVLRNVTKITAVGIKIIEENALVPLHVVDPAQGIDKIDTRIAVLDQKVGNVTETETMIGNESETVNVNVNVTTTGNDTANGNGTVIETEIAVVTIVITIPDHRQKNMIDIPRRAVIFMRLKGRKIHQRYQ